MERKTSRRTSILIAAVAVIVIIVIAGAYVYLMPKPGPAVVTEKKFSMAVVTSSSPTDLSWTAAAYDGMMFIKQKYNATVDMTEYVSYADAERVVRDYAARGFTMVFAWGLQYEDAVVAVAPEYPNTFFMVSAGQNHPDLKNVISFSFAREQGSYVIGYIAALLSKTNFVASIAGWDYPDVLMGHEAYKLGARTAVPGIKATTLYAQTWSDPVKGKELANSLIQAGADFIWAQSDLTNRGIIDACREAKVKMAYTDYDAWVLAPEIMITSVTINMSRVMDFGVQGILSGNFKGGEFWRPGMNEGVIALAPYHETDSMIPQSVKDKIASVLQDIISGKFVVPRIYEATP